MNDSVDAAQSEAAKRTGQNRTDTPEHPNRNDTTSAFATESTSGTAPPPYAFSPPPRYTPQQRLQQGQRASPLQSFPVPTTHQSHLPPTQPFPPSFNIYNISTFGRLTLCIAQQQSHPIYAVSYRTGMLTWQQSPMILHNGDDTAPPLATVEQDGSWQSVISLPGPPSGIGGAGAMHVRFNIDLNFGVSSTWGFAMPVPVQGGSAGGQRVEEFEWRHSRGGEVSMLGGASHGWKLVRLGPGGFGYDNGSGNANSNNSAQPTSPQAAPPGQQVGMVRPTGTASDGNEVVAVWATNGGMSMTKVARFAFLGNAAHGHLGEVWNVVAVVSMLRMYQIERRKRQRGR